MSDERKPMIENSDRGFTINKTLAWSMCCAMILSATYVGQTIASLSGQMAESRQAWTDAAKARQELDVRVRAVEVAQAGQSSDLRAIQIGIVEIKTGLARLAGDRP